MNKIDDGGPAFPVCVEHTMTPPEEFPGALFTKIVSHGGLTLRDWFAGMAMQGMLSTYRDVLIHDADEKNNRHHYGNFGRSLAVEDPDGPIEIAGDAYVIADAMIAEKRRTEGAKE